MEKRPVSGEVRAGNEEHRTDYSSDSQRSPILGVLALQGAFRAHRKMLDGLGVESSEVRSSEDLPHIDALIMPGGESTTMSLLLESSGLFESMDRRISEGLPVFGTCAGMILLAAEVEDGRPDQRTFARLDLAVRRNGYGRQVESFEAELAVDDFDEPFHAVFIRAPLVTRAGPDVEVLARDSRDAPVLVRQGNCLAAAFHPELSGDDRIHRLFVEAVAD